MSANGSRQFERLGRPEGPEPPFPRQMEGNVISGFGRGSSELGIPTANLPVDAAATSWINDAKSGVYFGYASLKLPSSHADHPISSSSSSSSSWITFPQVMSIGYNPFYKNAVRSAEVHVLHKFKQNFYDVPMRCLLLGYVRPELDYSGLEALVADINRDRGQTISSFKKREAWVPAEGVWMPVVKMDEDGQFEFTGDATWEKGTFDGSWLVRDSETEKKAK